MKHGAAFVCWAAVGTLAACLVGGCTSQPTIEGRWSGQAPSDPGGITNVTYEFLPDGLVTMAGVKGSSPQGPKPEPGLAEMMMPGLADIASVNVVGKYSIKNDVLTIVPQQVTMRDKNGKEPSLHLKLETKTQISRFKLDGSKLTIDKLDGSKPTVLERQSAS